MFKLNKILMLFALCLVSVGSYAAPTIHTESLGTLGPAAGPAAPDILFIDQMFEPGAIDDIFLFDINTGGLPSSAAASMTSVVLMTTKSTGFGPIAVLDIPDFKFALTNASGVLLTGFVGTGESVSIDPAVNGATYGIWFKGNATGLAGGAVSGPLALSAVPIPAAVWLFGSALVGLFGYRRSGLLSA